MANPEPPPINPYLAVLLGVAAASSSSILTKLAEAPAMPIAFYRLGLATMLIVPFALRGTNRTALAGLTVRSFGLALASGLFLALHFTVWITSLEYTSIASSTVLVTMQPLFVVTGSALLLGERITPRGLIGAVLALAGSIIIGINDFQIGGQAFWGDVLAFAGALFIAGYVLIGRILRATMDVIPYTFLVYGAATVLLGTFSVAADQPLGPYPTNTWIVFLALAILPTLLGHSVFNWALRYVGAAVVSVSILGEPVGASILAYFIFGQVPTFLQVIGGLIIIGGLAFFLDATRREEKVQDQTQNSDDGGRKKS